MTTKDLPSPDILRKLLRYEAETGKLFWMARPDAAAWNARLAGKEAFTATSNKGYRTGVIFYKQFLAHRVIWAMQSGAWPTAMIDHIDGDKLNNCWSNLREATNSQNQQNRSAPANNTSGYKGVSLNPTSKRWRAYISIDGKRMHLGYHDTKEQAYLEYCRAAAKMHGEFACKS